MALVAFPVDESRRKAGFQSYFGDFHKGIDIFSDRGTPILAVDSGWVRAANDQLGGKVVYLRCADGQTYYYAHLDDYIGTYPRTVQPGEPIGTMGTTGNAAGKAPHLHFEVHPFGDRQTVDPFPQLVLARNQVNADPGNPAVFVDPNPAKSSESVLPKVVVAVVGLGLATLTTSFIRQRFGRR